MKNKNIKQIAFTVVTGLFLSACGGGDSNVAIVSPPPVAEVKVPQCGTAALGRALAADVTGKTIQKVETGAEVRIWHYSDATKFACMISGEALIN